MFATMSHNRQAGLLSFGRRENNLTLTAACTALRPQRLCTIQSDVSEAVWRSRRHIGDMFLQCFFLHFENFHVFCTPKSACLCHVLFRAHVCSLWRQTVALSSFRLTKLFALMVTTHHPKFGICCSLTKL